MYEVNETKFVPDNFHCGGFPAVTGFGAIKTGAEVRRHAPVAQGEDGLAEVTAETLSNLVGIAADAPDAGGNVVYYQTGTFRAESVVLPTGVTVEALAAACRPLNIYLK